MNYALSANDLYLLAPELGLTLVALAVMMVDLFRQTSHCNGDGGSAGS